MQSDHPTPEPRTQNPGPMKKIDPDFIVLHLQKAISGLQAVYVYGSYLTDSFSDESDLDIAIKVEGGLENRTRWDIQEELASKLGRNIDLLNLDSESLVMQFEVVSSGERVFSVNEEEIQQYEPEIGE